MTGCLSDPVAPRPRAQIDAIRSLLELACLGTAYAATGNLAAPFAASTVSDMLFSTYQRIVRFLLRACCAGRPQGCASAPVGREETRYLILSGR